MDCTAALHLLTLAQSLKTSKRVYMIKLDARLIECKYLLTQVNPNYFFMKQVEQIQAEIEALSQNDFVQLREWFTEKDWLLWDEQLEADVASGKLDFLMEEAMLAKSQGQLQDLATGLTSASNDAAVLEML